MYRIADANELLVITGFGIKDFSLRKKKFVFWPFQRCAEFIITPLNYEVTIKALSNEKLAFQIPASLTIGPCVDDEAKLKKYVRLLVSDGNLAHQEEIIRERVRGIVEGEMRAVAASMPIEEIYNNRREFQAKVTEFISEMLDKFGLVLYNANVKELVDVSGYFSTMSQKASEGAAAQALVSVADSKARGDIGACERNSRSTKETARLKAETVVYENERQQQVVQSNTELKVKEFNLSAQEKIALVEGRIETAMKEAEMQIKLEQRRANMEVERLRAKELTKVVVQAEKIRKLADAKAYEIKKEADARRFQEEKNAEGLLFEKQKEAEGALKLLQAQANGVQKLMEAFGDSNLALQYLMLEKDVFVSLAEENRKAIKGMQPQFNIWTTDPAQNQGGLGSLMQSLPPVLSAVKNQTGIEPPQWLAQMPQENEKKLCK